jgi:hypothetical protein
VFVEAHEALPLPLNAACAALDAALADGGLTEESRRAAEEGAAFFMRVGPGGSRALAKQVLVQLLPAEHVGRKVVVPMRWEATGKAGRLFPSLDANLTLSSDEEGGSTISIVATYRPPLDVVSAGLDRMVLSRAADATLAALLREIAKRLLTVAPLLPQGPSTSTVARAPDR